MQYPQGMDGAAILNGMLASTIENERQRILDDLQARIDGRLQFLEQDIEGKRASYQASKEGKIARLLEADSIRRAGLEDELRALRGRLKMVRDSRIQQLNEAIQIATRLGIVKPTTPGALGEVGQDGSRSVFRTEVNNQQIPLYFMGVDALTAERDTLLKRKGDDFTEPRVAKIQQELKQLENNREVQYLQARKGEERFFENIDKLRGEQARLQTLRASDLKIELVRVDQKAATPLRPIKPRKALVVALGLLGGLALGVLVALVRAMLRAPRQRVQEDSLPPGVVSLDRSLPGPETKGAPPKYAGAHGSGRFTYLPQFFFFLQFDPIGGRHPRYGRRQPAVPADARPSSGGQAHAARGICGHRHARSLSHSSFLLQG